MRSVDLTRRLRRPSQFRSLQYIRWYDILHIVEQINRYLSKTTTVLDTHCSLRMVGQNASHRPAHKDLRQQNSSPSPKTVCEGPEPENHQEGCKKATFMNPRKGLFCDLFIRLLGRKVSGGSGCFSSESSLPRHIHRHDEFIMPV
jgi:hypothetical protein